MVRRSIFNRACVGKPESGNGTVFLAKTGVMVPGVPYVDRGNWGQERNIARSWQNSVFYAESFGKYLALYVHLAYKDVDLFPKGSVLDLCTSQIEASTSPSRAYPGHLMSFLARERGNLISTHRGRGIWLLASMSCYKLKHGGDDGDVKLWWIQRKRLRICGGLVENQRPTQAVFRIWRCLRPIYIYSM